MILKKITSSLKLAADKGIQMYFTLILFAKKIYFVKSMCIRCHSGESSLRVIFWFLSTNYGIFPGSVALCCWRGPAGAQRCCWWEQEQILLAQLLPD